MEKEDYSRREHDELWNEIKEFRKEFESTNRSMSEIKGYLKSIQGAMERSNKDHDEVIRMGEKLKLLKNEFDLHKRESNNEITLLKDKVSKNMVKIGSVAAIVSVLTSIIINSGKI